ncbi:MAG: ABC transporter permease [Bacteroidetes bacterium]|nr:ABC transporter permease [Bacteroidota bacterium]
MWVLKLAWKNLWRNRGRTAVTISAVFFAVVLSITAGCLQDGVFANLIRNMVSFYSGYIQIHQSGYWDQQVLDNSMTRDEQIEESIRKEPGVTAFSPRIESYALASAGEVTKGCMVVGVDPEKENAITMLKSKVVAGAYFPHANASGALVSEGLLQRLGLALGDTVILLSQGYHGALAAGQFPITGVLKFGSPELNDQLLYLSLPSAQDFFSAPGQLTSYVLALESDDVQGQVQAGLQSALGSQMEVMNWGEMMPEVEQHINTDKSGMYTIQIILYLLICFGIFGTLLMMMAERQHEMGMLIAIGMKKAKLVQVVLAESVLTVLVGCLAGMLASVAVTYYLKNYPIRFGGDMADMYKRYGFEPIFPASMNPTIFFTQGIIVLALALVLGLYPMFKVLRMNPVLAMKN